MPTYQVEHDGKKFNIEAADPNAAAEALSMHTGAKPSLATSIVRGAMQGVTANFGDELFAMSEAGGGGVKDERMGIDHLIGGMAKYFSGDKAAREKYEAAVARERGENKAANEAHPWAYTGGEVAGAAMLPIGAGGAAATLPARMAVGAGVGGAAGALSGAGAGEGPADTVNKGVTGAGLGVLAGGAAPVAMKGIEAVAPVVAKAVAPIANQIRGFKDPEAEAARRVMTALVRDHKNMDPGLSGREFQAARAEGMPAAVMDMGGETTRALARSAANTSPEGRAVLNRAIDDRFEEQSPRLASWLRQTFHYPDAAAQQEALDTVAKTVNRGAYAKAYRDGDREIISDELHRLMGSPAVVDAMSKAATSGKDRAITQGVGAMRQGATVENGVVKFTKGPNGAPTYPNLAYWDAVKRELDDATAAAQRAGRKEEASTLTSLTKGLRDELDRMVPSYNAARSGASKFFGAGDALEAGQNFVGASSRFGLPEARTALAKMSPQERQLFQDGYVSRLVETIEKTGDRRNVVNQIYQSPAAREEIYMAIGPQRAKELETRLRVETIMDRMRGAVQGNSTTARQLAEAGLAGGTSSGVGYGVATGDWNPKDILSAAMVGSAIGGAGRYAGAKVSKGIDERVSRKVAEMLVADDPKVLQKGIAIVAKQPKLLAAIRRADETLARTGGNQVSGGSMPMLQGPVAGRTQDEQQ